MRSRMVIAVGRLVTAWAVRLLGWWGLWAFFLNSCLHAEMVVYEIDQNQSSITIVEGVTPPQVGNRVDEGSRALFIAAIKPQSPGSLTAQLAGALLADLNGETLTFDGGSIIDAVPNPEAPFLPFGPGEDNFGGQDQLEPGENGDRLLNVAVRDAAIDIYTGSATLGGVVTGLEIGYSDGVLDFESNLVGSGRLHLFELGSNLNQSGEILTGDVLGTIEIPIFLDVFYDANQDQVADDSRLVVEGKIVASRRITGDFNRDTLVGAADYTVWRDDLGRRIPIGAGADANFDGTVSHLDFTAWKTAYISAGSLPAHETVPEPTSICLAATLSGVAMAACLRSIRPR